MAVLQAAARPVEDRRPEGVGRVRQTGPTEALRRVAAGGPAVQRVILAEWADHHAYPTP